jgi:hypothetical protein
MQGLSELPFVCGFCYTQLTDIEQEANGLLYYNRRPKSIPRSWRNCTASYSVSSTIRAEKS